LSERYVIGVDCSTTATKAVVFDARGRAVAEARRTFPLSRPRPGWHEQRARDWWDSTRDAIAEVASSVDADAIAAIGLTHQRETFVCLDPDTQDPDGHLRSHPEDDVARYKGPLLYRVQVRRGHANRVLGRPAMRVRNNLGGVKVLLQCPPRPRSLHHRSGIHKRPVHIEQHCVAAECHVVQFIWRRSACQSAQERGSGRGSERRLAASKESASGRRDPNLQCDINSCATLYPFELAYC